MEELLIFNIHVYVFLYCHLFDNIFFVNIILILFYRKCWPTVMNYNGVKLIELDVVSFVFVFFLLMVPCQ
jgi:hypothetical protein